MSARGIGRGVPGGRERRRRQRTTRAIAVALAALVCVLAVPASSAAGTFEALTCHDFAGNAIGARGWSVGPPTAEYITFANDCGSGGAGSFGLTMGPYPNGAYNIDSNDSMTYTVPAGLTISSYSLDLYGYGEGCEVVNSQCSDGFGQAWVNHTGQGDPNYDYRNLGYGAVPAIVSVGELSNVDNVTVDVSCDPGQNLGNQCPGSSIVARALVSGGEFTIHDQTVPSVSGVSGTLIGGGTLSGTDAIDFTASDSGGGIYAAIVLIDGRAVVDEVPNNNGGLCVNLAPAPSATMAFASAQPCPNAENISIPVDTTSLSPGQHRLQVLVQDAAGDEVTAYEGTIDTAGPPLVGVNGGAISAGRGTPNGEPCAGEVMELAVNGTPVGNSVAGHGSGDGGPAAASLAEGNPETPVIPYGKPVTVRGVLHCGTTPVRNAHVAVTTVDGSAGDAIDTTVQTALDGSFEYHVPTGPDRTLDFSYTAYSNDTAPSATATATISISPQIKLHIRPRRTRNGHTIHWTGTIAGGPYPRHGVTLDVEVKEGRHWKVFGQVVAGSQGRFRYGYRFHATTESVTYTFRVAMPDTGARNYPYAPGASNTVRVHVAP